MKTSVYSIVTFFIVNSCATLSQGFIVSEVSEKNNTIFVVIYGWHSGIVIPAEELSSELLFVKDNLDETPYYEFGWGDSVFYPSEKITIIHTMDALFCPGSSVIRVLGMSKSPALLLPAENVIKLSVAKENYHLMIRAIANSFKRNLNENPRFLFFSKYGFSAFYAAAGKYSVFNTCNSWTAEILQKAGFPLHGFMNLTPGKLMEQLQILQSRGM